MRKIAKIYWDLLRKQVFDLLTTLLNCPPSHLPAFDTENVGMLFLGSSQLLEEVDFFHLIQVIIHMCTDKNRHLKNQKKYDFWSIKQLEDLENNCK